MGGDAAIAMMQDCVIGCLTNYAWDKVQVWARSLGGSGFMGRKVALVRALGHGCREGLVNEGFEVVDFSHLPVVGSPYVERFSFLRRYLYDQRSRGLLFRWVVTTDVRDVCFQRNPLDYLARFDPRDPPRLVLSQEGLRYEHAPWNYDNMRAAFGEDAVQMLRDVPFCNVGVLAGSHRAIEGLAFLIEQLSIAARNDVSDQAALNLLVEEICGEPVVHRASSAEPWACHAGVMADRRIEQNRPFLVSPEPVWCNGLVLTASGEPYVIVHQYDRAAWRVAIEERYGGSNTP
jgi:hypothetical protein